MAKPYESDVTRMMRELLQQNPHIVEEQKKGRALWWDKAPRPLAVMKETETATVPNKAYYYDAN